MRMYLKNIVCATDFSDLSNHAIAYGVYLAREFKAMLYLCHVIDLSSATIYGEATFGFEPQITRMEEYAQERLKRIMAGHEIEWEPFVTSGNASIGRVLNANMPKPIINKTSSMISRRLCIAICISFSIILYSFENRDLLVCRCSLP